MLNTYSTSHSIIVFERVEEVIIKIWRSIISSNFLLQLNEMWRGRLNSEVTGGTSCRNYTSWQQLQLRTHQAPAVAGVAPRIGLTPAKALPRAPQTPKSPQTHPRPGTSAFRHTEKSKIIYYLIQYVPYVNFPLTIINIKFPFKLTIAPLIIHASSLCGGNLFVEGDCQTPQNSLVLQLLN